MAIGDYVLLVLLGLVAGAGGGLLGIGGSVVMIPGMILLLGADRQHLYQATAMIVNFFVVAPAVWRHRSAKAILRPVTRWTVPSAVAAAVAGVFVSELPVFRGSGQGYLQIGFAVFLLYVVVHNVDRLGSRRLSPVSRAAEMKPLSAWRIVSLVGLPTGMLGGLLGVGGGLYAVPAQQVGFGIPLPTAIANSAATILWASVVGAFVKNASLGQHGVAVTDSLRLASCLIPSAMIGSWYASAKVHQWPVGAIRAVYIVLLLYCGARVFLMGWQQLCP